MAMCNYFRTLGIISLKVLISSCFILKLVIQKFALQDSGDHKDQALILEINNSNITIYKHWDSTSCLPPFSY